LDRINKYCDGLIESAWLLALIVTPLFFISDLFRSFEAPKIFIFRSIVFFALAAWLIKGIAHIQPGVRIRHRINFSRQFHDLPILYPVLGLLLVYLISTVFSISPRTSLMGSYIRLEGALTLITYLILFVIMIFNLRTRQQVERLVAVLALVCMGVDQYAILQHFHLDPFYWPDVEKTSRVISTIGQPIFTAVFLVMAFFVLLSRSILAIQDFLIKRVFRIGNFILALVYILISILNLVSIWFTVSRGPLLGLLGGIACFLLLLLLFWQLRRVLHVLLAVGALMLSLLFVINIPSGPLASLRDAPVIGPLGHLLDTETGTGQTRVLIWQGMARLNAAHDPLPYPDQTTDRWNPVRWLVGYGPDTIGLAYEGFYNPQLYILEASDAIYDRSHNRLWDVIGFSGLLGFLAEYGLFLGLFYYALHWLGLANSIFERNLYWILALAGGLSGLIMAFVISRPEYIGPFAHLGMMAGLIGVLVYRVIRPVQGLQSRLSSWHAITLIGLLSALLSHYIELSTGISTFTSRMLFCIMAALLLVIGKMMVRDQVSETKNDGVPDPVQNGLRQVAINSSILGLIIVTLGSRFLVDYRAGPGPVATLIDALTSISFPTVHTSYGILVILVVILVVGSLLLQLEGDVRYGHGLNWKYGLATAGIALIFSALVLLLRSEQLVRLNTVLSSGNVPALISGMNWLTWVVYIFLFIFFLFITFLLSISWREPVHKMMITPLAGIAMVACAVLALISVVGLNLRPQQADILYSAIFARTKSGDHATATKMYEQLLALKPEEPIYQLFAGKLYGDMIKSTVSENEKEQYFQSGLEHITRAYELEPLAASNEIVLAHYYQQGGGITSDSSKRNVRYLMANTYYAAALKIKPSRYDYWLDWANLCALRGDIQCATDRINSALAVNSSAEQIYQFIGDLFSLYAKSLADQKARFEAYDRALKGYQTQADLITSKGGNPAVAYFGMGGVYAGLEQYEQARTAYLQAAQLGSDQNQWLVYKSIASMSALLKDTAMQREYLQKALELAPQDQKIELKSELDKLAP